MKKGEHSKLIEAVKHSASMFVLSQGIQGVGLVSRYLRMLQREEELDYIKKKNNGK